MEYQFESSGPVLRMIVLVFLLLFIIVAVAALVGIAALPGWVAKKRHHPQAAAINICGWLGLPTGILWVWAYLKTDQEVASQSDQQLDLLQKLDQLEATLAKLEGSQS